MSEQQFMSENIVCIIQNVHIDPSKFVEVFSLVCIMSQTHIITENMLCILHNIHINVTCILCFHTK